MYSGKQNQYPKRTLIDLQSKGEFLKVVERYALSLIGYLEEKEEEIDIEEDIQKESLKESLEESPRQSGEESLKESPEDLKNKDNKLNKA